MNVDIDGSLLDVVDGIVYADDELVPAEQRRQAKRETWGRTPEAIADQQRAAELFGGPPT